MICQRLTTFGGGHPKISFNLQLNQVRARAHAPSLLDAPCYRGREVLRESMASSATLSMKDAQRCFDKTLRQQLVKKDQSAARASAAASAHAIQLKREIAALQSSSTAVEAERSKFQEQFTHTSSLLETALDQRQEDQSKLTRLNEKLRTLEKKHDETLTLVKNEAAANVRATQEERQALRARVEQLRCRLESERKQWQSVHAPMTDELQKCKTRLGLVDKELQDARYRECSNFQLKEKMAGEVTKYQRKVTDLSMALQEALHGKSELKAEHSLMVKHMKDKWREMLRSHQHAKEQLWMLQEDYNGLFRTRVCIEEQNEHMYLTMKQMKARYEQAMKAKEEECWEIEKKHKKLSTTCPRCMKTVEQKEQEDLAKLDAVREQTRLEVTKNLELERWDRFQEVNAKYMDACRQLQTAVEESEQLRSTCKTLAKQHQELQEAEKKLSCMLKEAEAKAREASAKQGHDAKQMDATKKAMHDLMENLTSLTAVVRGSVGGPSEFEGDSMTREDSTFLAKQISELEAEKSSLTDNHERLTQRYEEFVAQYELLKQEKSKHWNDIVEAQLSANLLIELDKAYVSPSKSTLTSEGTRFGSPVSEASPSDMPTRAGPSSCKTPTEASRLVAALRQECETLREEVDRLKNRFRDERAAWQSDNEKKGGEFVREIKTLQLERAKLTKRLEEQALTIHELTLQEDEEDEEQSSAGGTEQAPGGSDLFAYSRGSSYPEQEALTSTDTDTLHLAMGPM
ncbi:hypothetical protein BBJ28_00013310 [Nothophytophthora sp. Chile5]|nr:hypothetical protein BBJ28_00013310 [Nothophytophthora sp. Chile5]